jgi:hypothetical protein
MRRMRLSGVRLRSNRRQPHHSPQALHSLTINPEPLATQHGDPLAAPLNEVSRIQFVDRLHPLPVFFCFTSGSTLVIPTGTVQPPPRRIGDEYSAHRHWTRSARVSRSFQAQRLRFFSEPFDLDLSLAHLLIQPVFTGFLPFL